MINQEQEEEIKEVRAILGKEFDFIPDQSIVLMINGFKLMAKIIVRDMIKN